MTIWYRASTSAQIETVFSGEGGLYAAGRWHHKGNPVIYCSASIALCTLEWLAQHGLSISAFDYYRYAIDIPDSLIKRYTQADLPANWMATPATSHTRDFAQHHLFASSFAIAVPSAIIPEEYNLVINPRHTHFKKAVQSIKALGRYIAPKR